MLISRISPFSGESNEIEIDVTGTQLVRWENGEHIQDVMSHLSPDEREFIMTGITPEEWEETFGKE